MVKKKLALSMAKSVIAKAPNLLVTDPLVGGVAHIVAEVFGWGMESLFFKRRLGEFESLLVDEETEVFLTNIKNLNEHDYYAVRKILKFHCFEAMLELTTITAKSIISYIINKSSHIGEEQVFEILCQLNASDVLTLQLIKNIIVQKKDSDYSERLSWKEVCPITVINKDGDPISVSMEQCIHATTNSEYIMRQEIVEKINSLALSISKLKRLGILTTFSDFSALSLGLNNDYNFDELAITPIGTNILGYVDIDYIEIENHLNSFR